MDRLALSVGLPLFVLAVIGNVCLPRILAAPADAHSPGVIDLGPVLPDNPVQCDGKDDTRALNEARRLANGQAVIIASGQTCAASDITLPSLRIERGGLLKPLTGHVITLGDFAAGPYQTFANALTGQGTISLPTQTVACPQWWGGTADGATPSQTYISAALNSGAGRVEMTAGDWKITAPIIWNHIFVTLHGANTLGTYISAGAGVASMIKFEGPVSPGAGGYQIEGVRFNGFSGSNFDGYAIDATINTFIDSAVRNCWFGLSMSAKGAFHGKAVNVWFDSNTFELGANTLHFTLASSLKITGNHFWSCFYNVIDFDNAQLGQFNGISIVDNTIAVHQWGTAIKATNAQDLLISDLIYDPSDVIPAADPNRTSTVFDFDNSDVTLSNIKVSGGLAYLDNDRQHTGTAYTKILYALKSANGAAIRISNSSFKLVQWGLYLTGKITLQVSQLEINQAAADGIYMNNVTGLVSLDHVRIERPGSTWISQNGLTTADCFIRNSEFYDARWNGSPGYGFLLSTKGNLEFNSNVVAKDSSSSALSDFFQTTLSDGAAFFDNNRFIDSVALRGHIFSSNSIGYRVGLNRGMPTGYYAETMPTAGSYRAGDMVINTNPVEMGPRGSKYIVFGWKRLTTGDKHELKIDWFEMRMLTGN
jgi:hypothetical protein